MCRYYSREMGQSLDILVNNVGVNIRRPTLEYTPEEVLSVINTNLLSFFHLTR